MKKMMLAVAIVCVAAFANAAAVGWNLTTGSTTYASDAYAFFVIGQNGVTDAAQISTLLSSADYADYSNYAFGSGTIGANGTAMVQAGSSGKTLGAGNYEGFFVLFDKAAVTDAAKYMVISGLPNLSIEIGASTASKTFMTGNAGSYIGGGTWSPVSGVPEPTSGLLLLLGVAGLALKRKIA